MLIVLLAAALLLLAGRNVFSRAKGRLPRWSRRSQRWSYRCYLRTSFCTFRLLARGSRLSSRG